MPSLRQSLLPFSIRNAASLPFYTQFWEGIDVDAISSINDLRLLPTLSKKHYRQSLMFDGSAISDTDYITHTTGTTGAVTWRHRSAAEAAIIDELFGSAAEPTNAELMLVIRYNRHGMSMPMPGQTRGMPIGLNDDTELKQCVQMLTATYRFAEGSLRPTILAGGGHDIAVVTQAWLEARVPTDTAIRTLHLLGFVDAGLRRFLHSAFKEVEIFEKYSLTEIFGGATRRSPSTSFTLDPYVVGEVVDEDGAPVPRGSVGELVLTELFPFVQMQPLIRYRTGDVVRLVDDEEENLVFDWWGRRHECVLAQSRHGSSWVLGYSSIADWLSLQTLVARHSYRPYLSSVTSTDLGPPCLTLSSEPDSVTMRIDVGLRINPWWAKQLVLGLAQELWAALRSMVVVSAENVRVRLSFRHVPFPTEDFNAGTDTHDLQLPAGMLSDPAPTLP